MKGSRSDKCATEAPTVIVFLWFREQKERERLQKLEQERERKQKEEEERRKKEEMKRKKAEQERIEKDKAEKAAKIKVNKMFVFCFLLLSLRYLPTICFLCRLPSKRRKVSELSCSS